MLDTEMFLKFVFAFAFVMGLMFLLSWFLKKMGLAGHGMIPGGKRRLKIVEHMPLDSRHRLVLVRRDDREHLLVIGPAGETLVESNIPAATEVNVAEVVELPAQKEQKNV